MKKLLKIILTAALLIGVTACSNTVGDEEETTLTTTQTTEATTTETTTAAPPETTEATTTEVDKPENNPLPMLELLGYATHNGEVLILADNWTDTPTADDFRQHFFGTWEVVGDGTGAWQRDTLTIDDTVNTQLNINLRMQGFFDTGHGAITWYSSSFAADNSIFWIDYENPDIMYYTSAYNDDRLKEQYGYVFRNFQFENGEFTVITYKRTTDPIAEPQDGYLSWLRLQEITAEYDISWNMLTQITLTNAEDWEFFHNDHIWFYPVYLVSESPDKLVLSTMVGTGFFEHEIDITYTIEKINGEWVRTVEEV
ncbi:MAG: hypothetical protein FWD34_04900 [Oscillospiraceae bacterium]|nr:hypothetical protein [Oscillospiraceae bacterium]